MKMKICRWLYNHRMERIAWMISPSIACMLQGEALVEGYRNWKREQESKNENS